MKYKLTNEEKIAYKQVLEILNNMEQENIEKVPVKLVEFFKENCDKTYVFSLDNTVPLKEQNINKYALALLGMLYINYWCKDENEKKELLNKYSDNERKYQEELREKYNVDNIFKNREINKKEYRIEKDKDKEENLPIRLTWYEKLRAKIKSIFKKDEL